MTDEPPVLRISRLGRAAFGGHLAGYIYGTVVVLAVVVAAARSYSHAPGHIAVLVAATSGGLWLAHVYAHGLGESVARNRHLSLEELGHVAQNEASILEAAVPPVVALLLGFLGVLSDSVAIWGALVLGLLVLAAQGVLFARVERLGWLGTLAVVAANLALGLGLIGVKLLVTHY
jgi:hypothetical protein